MPVRNPPPRGDHATIPTPCSSAAASSSASMGVHSDHSTCTAATGCTQAARRSWSAVDVRQPDVCDEALGHELGHRADGVLDGHLGVGEVRVPEVDALDAEPVEAGERVLPDVSGLGVDGDLTVATNAIADAVGLGARREAKAELGRDDDVARANPSAPGRSAARCGSRARRRRTCRRTRHRASNTWCSAATASPSSIGPYIPGDSTIAP